MRLKDITTLNPQYRGKELYNNVSFVPMESLRNGSIDLKDISFAEGKGKYTYFGNGDLLVAKVTPCFENGNIAIADNLEHGIGFGSSEIFVLRMKKGFLNSYLFYLSQTSKFQDAACATMCGVGGLKRISPLFMRTYELDLPVLSEQQRIVEKLDAQLSSIDKRISALEKQLDAYAQLKKSIIHQAVTRGLNLNVTLKDSGIEWIGMIPEHWNELHLKNCVCINNGSDYKDIEVANGFPVIGSGGVFAYASEKMYDGEVLFLGRKGTIDKPLYYNGPFWSVDTMFYAVPKKNSNCKYLYYCSTQFPFGKISTATALPSMTQKELYQLPIMLPPLSEQQEIANYLDEKCAKIDAAIENITKQIDASKRLRKAIINEAISG